MGEWYLFTNSCLWCKGCVSAWVGELCDECAESGVWGISMHLQRFVCGIKPTASNNRSDEPMGTGNETELSWKSSKLVLLTWSHDPPAAGRLRNWKKTATETLRWQQKRTWQQLCRGTSTSSCSSVGQLAWGIGRGTVAPCRFVSWSATSASHEPWHSFGHQEREESMREDSWDMYESWGLLLWWMSVPT